MADKKHKINRKIRKKQSLILLILLRILHDQNIVDSRAYPESRINLSFILHCQGVSRKTR